jgi:hypothetical protein
MCRLVTDQERRVIIDCIDSPAFKLLMLKCFMPVYRRWAQRVLFDASMEDTERKGLVNGILAIKEGFLKLYENSGIKQPEWLIRELEILNA